MLESPLISPKVFVPTALFRLKINFIGQAMRTCESPSICEVVTEKSTNMNMFGEKTPGRSSRRNFRKVCWSECYVEVFPKIDFHRLDQRNTQNRSVLPTFGSFEESTFRCPKLRGIL